MDGEILVKVPAGVSPQNLVGQFLDVKITGAGEYDLIAEVI